MKLDDVFSILKDVPNYHVFLTVDELQSGTRLLAARYPEIVEILPIGVSRRGDSIEAIKIGDGPRRALLYAMPHPNEPIGSMMLEFLSLRLAEDDKLRDALGYTWYLVKCVDPDGTRLNEGWFKGPFSVENYARYYYRPPMFQQVEWTFPVDYKTLHFHNPLPETRALMALIEQVRPDFIYSLHNSGFGGVYFYITEEAPSLYEPFHKLVESQGLPLHLGEPEEPHLTEYARAIYKTQTAADEYDFLEENTEKDPAEIWKCGTVGFDYARAFCDPFEFECEVPYYYNPAIHDTSPSDVVRRDAILQMAQEAREDFAFMKEQYEAVKSEVTVTSPFRDSLEEYLRTSLHHLAAHENWARSDPRTAEIATVAEKFDNMVVGRFYRLCSLGTFVRMIDAQIAATGESPALSSAREAAEVVFETHSADLAAKLEYTIIPIRKLVRVQLGSGLLAASYAAERQGSGSISRTKC